LIPQRIGTAPLAYNGLLRLISPGLGGPSISVCRICPLFGPICPLFGVLDPCFGPFCAAVSCLKQRR
jgi:hypothetical protein